MGRIDQANMAVAKSSVGAWFRLEFSGHKRARKNTRFWTEVRAGLATFFAMAYIISVNASIVADSGGNCVCAPSTLTSDPYCKDVLNPSYNDYFKCTQEVKRDMVTATAAITCLTSFCMGLFANMPISLGPGMGLNAYFTYQVVGFHGSGNISYELALTAIFFEGLIFFALSIFGIRQWLARTIPSSLKIAAGGGIGLYLALIGLTYSAGIGAITGGTDTPLQLAGCEPRFLDSVHGTCTGRKMRNPTMWLGIFCGGIFTTFLMMYRVKCAIVAGILLVSIISWPRHTSITFFPNTPHGDEAFEYFHKIVFFRPIQRVFAVLDWNITGDNMGQFFVALATFLYVDILDCTGTLYTMAQHCGVIDADTGDFEGSAVAYTVDALGITLGSLVGCPPVTAFIESGAGISEGGATGITAITTSICFFVSLFFAPLFSSIPPWATGCTLILVGVMMAKACSEINWRYYGDSIPAFLTLVTMPFTFSIAYGLIVGIIAYTILNGGVWIINRLSNGRITPWGHDEKDYWTWKVTGGLCPAWVKRLLGGQRDFWRDPHYEDQTIDSSFSDKSMPDLSNRSHGSNGRSNGCSNGYSNCSNGCRSHHYQHDHMNFGSGLTGDRSWDPRSFQHAGPPSREIQIMTLEGELVTVPITGNMHF